MALTALKRYPNNGTQIANPPIAIPATLANSVSWSSDLMPAGFGGVLFGLTSDQIVTIKIQRYADLAGAIPVGGLLTQALTASTPGYVGINDGLPFVSWEAQIANASGSLANLSGGKLLTGGVQ